MTTVSSVLAELEAFAPTRWAQQVYPGDNVGLLVGRRSAQVSRVLVALDVTDRVLREAGRIGAQLIVAHHPVIYGEGLRSITDETCDGRLLQNLIEAKIAAICMHTNWDAAPDGINDILARALGLVGELCILGNSFTDADGRSYGLGRVGYLERPLSARVLASQAGSALRCAGVRFVDGGRPCHFVAVGSGNSTSQWGDVLSRGCDTFITGDVKYHQFLKAQQSGVTLIDAGHFHTERIIIKPMAEYLRGRLPCVDIVETDAQEDPTLCVDMFG